MNRLLLPIILLAAVPASALVVTTSPGALSATLKDAGADTDSLEVRGTIDIRDLTALAAMSLDTLSLSDARIVAFSSTRRMHLGRHFFAADELPDYIFHAADIRVVTLPSMLKKIGEGAFASSAAVSVTVPEGVVEIGDLAFRDCQRLRKVSIPSTLAALGVRAFENSPRLSIVSLEGTKLSAIGERTFAGCSGLSQVSLPLSLTEIGELAFAGSGVTSLSAQQPVQLRPFALAKADALASSDIQATGDAEGVYYGDHALKDVSQKYAAIPALTFAYVGADYGKLAEGAAEIGDYAFTHSSNINLVLGEGLTRVGKGVLASSPWLVSIDASALKENIPAADEDAFVGLETASIPLCVERDFLDKWKADPVWGAFKVVPNFDSVEEIEDATFSIRARDGVLYISGSRELLEVSVFSSDGRLLAAASPRACSAEIPFALPTDGILIVNSRTDASSRCDKLLTGK